LQTNWFIQPRPELVIDMLENLGLSDAAATYLAKGDRS
jgi:hypothetical protein